jgi:hypothetical protein
MPDDDRARSVRTEGVVLRNEKRWLVIVGQRDVKPVPGDADDFEITREWKKRQTASKGLLARPGMAREGHARLAPPASPTRRTAPTSSKTNPLVLDRDRPGSARDSVVARRSTPARRTDGKRRLMSDSASRALTPLRSLAVTSIHACGEYRCPPTLTVVSLR